MCGIVGLSLNDRQQSVVSDLLEATSLLQHRGQDACGIAVKRADEEIEVKKGYGLVSEVFTRDETPFAELYGCLGISHVRYTTNTDYSEAQVQPLIGSHPARMAICHNGNLVNSEELKEYLFVGKPQPQKFLGDSEAILELLLSKLSIADRGNVEQSNILAGLLEVYERCRGSFACVVLIPRVGMIAFRDSHGIKPLVFGTRKSETGGYDVMFASESVALQQLSFSETRDVKPGELILVPDASQGCHAPSYIAHQVVRSQNYAPDIFEYVYFARPDSIMDGISVNYSRQLMGRALGHKVKQQLGPNGTNELCEIDCIIPIPETSYIGALAVSEYLQKPFVFGFVRNKYANRTFLASNQTQRIKGVRRKLSAITKEFSGRNVLIIDDSIVRGTTSAQVVAMARAEGAKKVFLASCSPPIRFKHIHGIDIADVQTLVAHNRTNEQIRGILECDGIVYLPLQKLIEACIKARENEVVNTFETGVFSGKYVTDDRPVISSSQSVQTAKVTEKKGKLLLRTKGVLPSRIDFEGNMPMAIVT